MAVRYRSGERWQSDTGAGSGGSQIQERGAVADTGAESGGSQIQERRAVAVRYDQRHNTGTP